MDIDSLLAGWAIQHHAGQGDDDGFAKFVCPRPGCGGAAKVAQAPDDIGQWWLYCRCTRDEPTGGRGFTEDELAKWFGLNGCAPKHSTAATSVGPLLARSDAGNAEALTLLHGRSLRYVHRRDCWRCWTGTQWADDDTGLASQLVLQAMRARAQWALELADRRDAALEAKWALSSESAKRVRDCLALAATMPEFATRPSDYDANPWALNTLDGIIDLHTGELRPHAREEYHAKLAPVPYQPGAECRRWLQFLDEVFEGNQDLIAFIQRAIGYSLTGSTSEDCFFLCYGHGRNGKRMLTDTVLALLGGYGLRTDFATFTAEREKSASPRNDLARLEGVRMAVASESTKGVRFADGTLKALTGGDTITARFMYQEYTEFKPHAKIWLATNNKPGVRDTTVGFWSRVRLIPFNVCFLGREEPGLEERLRAERPGILLWALTGLREYHRLGGLRPPPEVLDATATYRREQDALAGFFEERTAPDPGAVTPAKALYDSYLRWAEKERSGERPATRPDFAEALRERGYTQTRSSRSRGWQGVRLIDG